MRKLLETGRGCPINQLYLELGQIPARFQVIKQRLFFLKHLLNQDPENMLYKVLYLQIEKPVKHGRVQSHPIWSFLASKLLPNPKQLELSMSNIFHRPIRSFVCVVASCMSPHFYMNEFQAWNIYVPLDFQYQYYYPPH